MRRILIILAVSVVHFLLSLGIMIQAAHDAVGAAAFAWCGGGAAEPFLERAVDLLSILPLAPGILLLVAIPDHGPWGGRLFYPVLILNSLLWGAALYYCAACLWRRLKRSRSSSPLVPPGR